ncbi:hypothetical protein [Aquimarina pacifica]|uniref:hypothetical protein n=1 Tax=Aquimarina pacifica TaxID=1296415 RepID=UPI00046E8446|nr:hypothetical protein [Aquimarina pacifica]
MEVFKKIVALSFIEAYQKNPHITSKTGLARKISESITEKEGKAPDDKHYKSLLNYFDFYFNDGKKKEPTETLINKLLGYLKFDSMGQFLKNQPSDLSYLERVPFVDYKPKPSVENKDDISDFKNDIDDDEVVKPIKDSENGRLKKITIVITFIVFASILYFKLNNQQKNCMIWVKDHYEKIACEKADGLEVSVNEELLENFRKVTLDTTMTFFKNGEALFWYDKTKGVVEFFNSPGIHPKHRTKLSPITETIIRKYVYKEE